MVIVVEDSQSESSSSDHGSERGKSTKLFWFWTCLHRQQHVLGQLNESSCRSHLKFYFVELGFAPNLVDKVLKENDKGDENVDLLLENLFAYSDIKKSSPVSDSPDGILNHSQEACKSASDDPDIEEVDVPTEGNGDRRETLLMMKFSVKEVEFAISRLGDEAPVNELVNMIVASQIAKCTERVENEPTHGNDAKGEEGTNEALMGTMEKTLCLLEMGFSSDAISSAIVKFGADIPISEIADSIFANQIAHTSSANDKDLSALSSGHSSHRNNDLMSVGSPTPTQERNKRRSNEFPLEETIASPSNATPSKDIYLEKMLKGKKPRLQYGDYSTFLRPSRPEARTVESQTTCLLTTSEKKESHGLFDRLKVVHQPKPSPCRSSTATVSKSPYFLYGNVVDFSHDTWTKLSQFLYGIEPEFVNTQLFSVLSRKEGYIHNLPTDNRFHILPRPPMTIEDTMPHTKKWWPTWDTRKQIGSISCETTGISKTCERLGKILSDSDGMITKQQLIDIVHQCKKFNLIWTGQHKLSPIEPDQVERILGYPLHHTQVSQFNTMERLRSLKHSFQIDTLGYHLSVLRWIFPQGITVLSLYSGIGGAEIALHRLGLRLKGLVSVESSETKQKILRNWWHSSGQTGELVQIQDVNRLTSNKLETLRRNMGDFDLVIGINPSAHISGNSKVNSDGENLAEPDFPLFFEFVRVLQHVKTMGRNR